VLRKLFFGTAVWRLEEFEEYEGTRDVLSAVIREIYNAWDSGELWQDGTLWCKDLVQLHEVFS
jgi:hypothetical protein